MYTKILLSTYYSTIDSILKISSLSHVARLHWIGGLLYIIIIYKMLKSKLQNINQTMNRKKVIKNINVEVFVKRNLSHSLLIVLTRSVEMRDSYNLFDTIFAVILHVEMFSLFVIKITQSVT